MIFGRKKNEHKKIEIFKHPFFKEKKMNKKGLEDSLFTWIIAFFIIFFVVTIFLLFTFLIYRGESDVITIKTAEKELNLNLKFLEFLESRIQVGDKEMSIFNSIKYIYEPYADIGLIQYELLDNHARAKSFAVTTMGIRPEVFDKKRHESLSRMGEVIPKIIKKIKNMCPSEGDFSYIKIPEGFVAAKYYASYAHHIIPGVMVQAPSIFNINERYDENNILQTFDLVEHNINFKEGVINIGFYLWRGCE